MLVIAALGLIAAIPTMGKLNSDSFYVVCDGKRFKAEQGSFFPPWGQDRMEGRKWAAIPIHVSYHCDYQRKEFDSTEAMAAEYRLRLLEQIDLWLGDLTGAGEAAERIDEVAAQVEQGLALSQGTDASFHKTMIRRRGAVTYWRARIRVDAARQELKQAIEQFGEAIPDRPHGITESETWQKFLQSVDAELSAGPEELRPPPPPGPDAGPQVSDTPPPDSTAPVENRSVEPPADRPDAGPGTLLPAQVDAAPEPPKPPAAAQGEMT